MLDWIKNLEPEFLILFSFSGLFLVLIIILLIKSSRTLSIIGKKALKIKETIYKKEEDNIVKLNIINTSFGSIRVSEVGYIYENALTTLSSITYDLNSRDSIDIDTIVKDLREAVIKDKLKIKKFYFYTKDQMGRVTKRVASKSRKLIKKELKVERCLRGEYNFIERTLLILALIFSPFTKLYLFTAEKINFSLKNGQNKKEINKLRKAKERHDHEEKQYEEHMKKLEIAKETYKFTDTKEVHQEETTEKEVHQEKTTEQEVEVEVVQESESPSKEE
jgi:hypothetical protein